MRKRSFVVVVAVIAALYAALPASVALPLVAALKPTIDPAVTRLLATHATSDVVIGFRNAPTLADVAELKAAGFRGPFERYSVVPAIAATATPGRDQQHREIGRA